MERGGLEMGSCGGERWATKWRERLHGGERATARWTESDGLRGEREIYA